MKFPLLLLTLAQAAFGYVCYTVPRTQPTTWMGSMAPFFVCNGIQFWMQQDGNFVM